MCVHARVYKILIATSSIVGRLLVCALYKGALDALSRAVHAERGADEDGSEESRRRVRASAVAFTSCESPKIVSFCASCFALGCDSRVVD